MRRPKTLLSTNIGVYLSLNIQVQKDKRESGLWAIPLISLSSLLLWWWSLSSFLNRPRSIITNAAGKVSTLQKTTFVLITLFGIGTRSVLYGVGLSG